ncbi:MAG: penicillin-binding transpeptidase domain-containing protein [Pseudomonadota bacterium]
MQNFFSRFLLMILALGFQGTYAQTPAIAMVEEVPELRAIVDATGFEGSVLIYDLHNNAFMAGHAESVEQTFLPASTFKIFSAMAALETGVIADKSTVIAWDGVQRSRTETNRDLDLQSAFRLSSVPHFQQLVKSVGAERMQGFIDAVGYGNRDISGGIDRFWLTGGLRVSPRQQVDFLVRLYRNELPFSEQSMTAVKEMMVTEEGDGYVLRAKTGWATLENQDNTGWWAGWVETTDNVYFFTSLLHANAPAESFGPARQGVVRESLIQLGILQAPL